MKRKSPHRARVASIAALVSLAAFFAGPAASQVGYKADPQGKDELWDVTSKMEMPGNRRTSAATLAGSCGRYTALASHCLLYTSDAADE